MHENTLTGNSVYCLQKVKILLWVSVTDYYTDICKKFQVASTYHKKCTTPNIGFML